MGGRCEINEALLAGGANPSSGSSCSKIACSTEAHMALPAILYASACDPLRHGQLYLETLMPWHLSASRWVMRRPRATSHMPCVLLAAKQGQIRCEITVPPLSA